LRACRTVPLLARWCVHELKGVFVRILSILRVSNSRLKCAPAGTASDLRPDKTRPGILAKVWESRAENPRHQAGGTRAGGGDRTPVLMFPYSGSRFLTRSNAIDRIRAASLISWHNDLPLRNRARSQGSTELVKFLQSFFASHVEPPAMRSWPREQELSGVSEVLRSLQRLAVRGNSKCS
jgi:hypothetical protein